MNKNDYFRAFLEEIESSGRGERPVSLSNIAGRLGVNRSSVLRGIGVYKEWGIIDDNYMLTDAGKLWFKSVTLKLTRLKEWFLAHQMDEEAAYTDALNIIKSCTEQGTMLLSNIGILCPACSRHTVGKPDWFGVLGEEFEQKYPDMLVEGKKVFFNFWKEHTERNIRELSMANAGFLQPAVIEKNTDGNICAALRIIDMTQQSNMGSWFRGTASAVEFERPWSGGGEWEKADIRDDVLRLPLSAFRIFYKGDFGCIRGRLHVRLECSAGNEAMPAGTAFLEIRMYE